MSRPDPNRIVYSVGVSLPGCLPESEPTIVETFAAAVDVLRDLLEAEAEAEALSWEGDEHVDPEEMGDAESALAELDAILRDEVEAPAYEGLSVMVEMRSFWIEPVSAADVDWWTEPNRLLQAFADDPSDTTASAYNAHVERTGRTGYVMQWGRPTSVREVAHRPRKVRRNEQTVGKLGSGGRWTPLGDYNASDRIVVADPPPIDREGAA